VVASSRAAKDCELGSWLSADACICDDGAVEIAVDTSDAIPGILDTRELLKATKTAHSACNGWATSPPRERQVISITYDPCGEAHRAALSRHPANFAAWRPAMAECGSAPYSIGRPHRMTIRSRTA
jgi:hypothetical protein